MVTGCNFSTFSRLESRRSAIGTIEAFSAQGNVPKIRRVIELENAVVAWRAPGPGYDGNLVARALGSK